MQPYSSTDMGTAWKNTHLFYHIINNLSIAVHSFPMCILTLLSVDEILLLRYINWSTNFIGLKSNMEMAISLSPYIWHLFILELARVLAQDCAILYWRLAVSHAAGFPSSQHQCCPRECKGAKPHKIGAAVGISRPRVKICEITLGA